MSVRLHVFSTYREDVKEATELFCPRLHLFVFEVLKKLA